MKNTLKNVTDEQLKEFYLCGLRTAYTSYQVNQVVKNASVNETAVKCDYCPSYHIIPVGVIDNENVLVEARKSFESFLTELNVPAEPIRTLSPETEAIVIRSTN